MRAKLCAAAAAALMLSTGAVMAQNAAPSAPATMPRAGTAPAQIHHPPAVNPLAQSDVSKIEGTGVYGADNKSVGHVSDVLIDPSTKKIDRLVVAVGGVFGIGSRHVALSLNKFSWDSSKGAFKVAETLTTLKTMPDWGGGNGAGGSRSSTPADSSQHAGR